jgi:hypothetical protein
MIGEIYVRWYVSTLARPVCGYRLGLTTIVALVTLESCNVVSPWSSDSASSTGLSHSSYLVILRISSSLSGLIFPTPDIARYFRRRFSYLEFPKSASIDDGLVDTPVVLSTHASRRTPSRAGHLTRICVLVILGGQGASPRYISSQNQQAAWVLFRIRFRYTPDSQWTQREMQRQDQSTAS